MFYDSVGHTVTLIADIKCVVLLNCDEKVRTDESTKDMKIMVTTSGSAEWINNNFVLTVVAFPAIPEESLAQPRWTRYTARWHTRLICRKWS